MRYSRIVFIVRDFPEMTMLSAVISLFCVATFQVVLGIESYCSNNNYVTNGTHMQFTKEPSVKEFAVVGTFKGLHCCAKNYRSIEWWVKFTKQYFYLEYIYIINYSNCTWNMWKSLYYCDILLRSTCKVAFTKALFQILWKIR